MSTPKNKISSSTWHKFFFLVASLALYTLYLVTQFGSQGFLLGGLTWSAFVMATPIADGGFLIDLPLRYATNIPMIISEVFVWGLAISLNIFTYIFANDVYTQTRITQAFYEILIHPWPNWIIIFVSALGTFSTLLLADKIYTAISNKSFKNFNHSGLQILFAVIGFIALYFGYQIILKFFGIEL